MSNPDPRATKHQRSRLLADQARLFNKMRGFNPVVFKRHMNKYLNSIDNPIEGIVSSHPNYLSIHNEMKLAPNGDSLGDIAARDEHSPAHTALDALSEVYQQRGDRLRDLDAEFQSLVDRIKGFVETHPSPEKAHAAVDTIQEQEGNTVSALERQHVREIASIEKLFKHNPQRDDYDSQEDFERARRFQDNLKQAFGVADLSEVQLNALKEEETRKLKQKHEEEILAVKQQFVEMKKNFLNPYRAEFQKAVFFSYFDPKELERYRTGPSDPAADTGAHTLVGNPDVDNIDLLAVDSYVTPNGKGLVQVNDKGGLTITFQKDTSRDARVDTYVIALQHQIARDMEIAKREGKDYNPATRTLNFTTDSEGKAEAMYIAYKKLGLREKINIKVGKGPQAKSYPDAFLTTQKDRDDFETQFSKYKTPEDAFKAYKNQMQDIIKHERAQTGDQLPAPNT